MTQHGFSMERLAKELNVSSASVFNWVNGSSPRNSTVKKIAYYFGLKPDELTDESIPLPDRQAVTDRLLNEHERRFKRRLKGKDFRGVDKIEDPEERASVERIMRLGGFNDALRHLDRATTLNKRVSRIAKAQGIADDSQKLDKLLEMMDAQNKRIDAMQRQLDEMTRKPVPVKKTKAREKAS